MEDALQQQKAGAETCADVTSQSSKSLHDNLAELQTRLAQVSRQLDALRNAPPPANNTTAPATESNPTAANPPANNPAGEGTGKAQAQTTIPH